MNAAPLAAGIFAKVPRAGFVKTRLVPPLTPEEAARIARVCLEETLRRFPAEVPAEWTLFLDGEPEAWLRRTAAGRRVGLAGQGAGDLGARLARAFRGFRDRGARRAIVIGSDSPTLAPERIRSAIECLEDADVVLGPTRDGGYYLVGAGVPCEELFARIPWGTDRVLAETMKRAAESGWRVTTLPAWYDLDGIQDLRRAALDAAALPALGALLASLLDRLREPGEAPVRR